MTRVGLRSKAGMVEDPLTEFYKAKQLGFEANIDVAYFASDQLTIWGIEFLTKANLSPLLSPPKFAYPRLVQLFYQKVKFVKPQIKGLRTKHMTVELGGTEYVINHSTIGEALGLSTAYEADSSLSPPAAYVDDDVIRELGGDPTVKRVNLPKRLLIIDHVFKRNLFPLGHGQSRKGPLSGALYSVQVGMWFSPASLIFQGIWEAKYHFDNMDASGKSINLPYPRAISAILKHLGIPNLQKEQVVTKFPCFGKKQFYYSANRLKNGGEGTSRPRKKDRKTVACEGSSSLGQYDTLCSGLDNMADEVREIREDVCVLEGVIQNMRGESAEMQSMVRALVKAQFPDNADSIFAEAAVARREAYD